MNLRYFILILLTFFTSRLSAQSYDRLVSQADKAIGQQNWSVAEELVIEAIRAEPENPGNILLLSNLGMLQFYQGKDSLALCTLTDAHRIAPSSVTVLCNRARVLTSVGMLDAAMADYDRASLLDSTIYQPYLYRGLIYLSTGNLINAENQLSKLNELAPNLIDTHVALAALYSALEKPLEAIPHFTTLIKVDPQAEYYAGRAMCYILSDMLLDASEDISDGMALDSDYAELYVCRALLNHKAYRKEEAFNDAQRAIDLGANRQRIFHLLDISR